MNLRSKQRVKIGIGLLLGLLVGATCRVLGIPSPAPPVLTGALLVVAMTVGYVITDRWCRREALNRHLCAGPDGSTQGNS